MIQQQDTMVADPIPRGYSSPTSRGYSSPASRGYSSAQLTGLLVPKMVMWTPDSEHELICNYCLTSRGYSSAQLNVPASPAAANVLAYVSEPSHPLNLNQQATVAWQQQHTHANCQVVSSLKSEYA